MPATDIVLRFAYPPPETNSDFRTFNVYRVSEESTEQVELYKVHIIAAPSATVLLMITQFYHPNTGMPIGGTTFHRKNLNTMKWETAGEIEWTSNTNARIYFGIDEVSIRDLRKPKNANSKSRRFKASGSEYKWKIAEKNTDLLKKIMVRPQCVDSRGRTVATWGQAEQTLRVEGRVGSILDRIVVTCLLHIWMRRQGQW
ncbi:hypothetical protein HETIRDRAFT_416015 [Heterobasidion irregulare TC 32-1]|uniref:DUF6593 domain-containing protein n=1 Tax=Heterobasidion irregulare (strain TC 32-1) TaxID=747525 RepID=W4KEQ2_HETIT|nr:uncharacterized protein HETIRDRAFT_416015 [Heterobasidion irregulare TC 32-1]ETW84312.1 hypothetical protein HETIRDRAFT_416015 [Heterobasidion irregulare TC 32-1]